MRGPPARRRQAFAITAVVAVVASHMTGMLWLNLYTPHVVGILLFSSTLLVLACTKNSRFGFRHLAFGPYACWITISALLAGSLFPALTPAAQMEAMSYMAFPLLFSAVAIAVENNSLSIPSLQLAFSVCLLFFLAIALPISYVSGWDRTSIIEKVGSLATHLAFGISITIPFALGAVLRGGPWGPAWLMAIVAGCSITAFILESRAGIIATGAGLLTFLLFRSRTRGIITAAAALGLVFILIPFVDDLPIVQRLETISSIHEFINTANRNPSAFNSTTTTEADRIISLAATFDFISESPIAGGGFHMLRESTFSTWGREVSGHGFILTIPAESGIIGGALFLLALATVLRCAVQIGHKGIDESAFASAFVIAMVFGIGHQTEYDQFLYFIGGAIVGEAARIRSAGQ